VPRIVVSGVGFVTSIGNDAATVTASLRELRSGIERFDFLPGVDLPVKVAGTVKGFDTSTMQWAGWRWPDGYSFNRDVLRGMPPHGLYALCAVEQLVRDAKLTPAELQAEDTGLFCASAGSPRLMRHLLNQIHDSRGERVPPMGVVSTIAGTLNFSLAAHFGIRGAVAGFASACASATQALGYASDEIALGRHRRVLVVGGEDLSFESSFPFSGMRALSRNPDPACASRPFDRERDGFVATGGATALLIEDADAAQARGAPIYAELLGWGQASDGFNVVHSHPDGAGLAVAMRRALGAARLTPAEIDYVNAHATSTPAGDLSEIRALHGLFSQAGAHPIISSTKGLTGHGLSFSGVMETGFCALALAQGFTVGNANLDQPDPACAGLELPRSAQPASRTVLKNSSGFGGANVCLVLRRWEP
jgi:3-oxoacyl-[acyl-carrier-protein] synthase I